MLTIWISSLHYYQSINNNSWRIDFPMGYVKVQNNGTDSPISKLPKDCICTHLPWSFSAASSPPLSCSSFSIYTKLFVPKWSLSVEKWVNLPRPRIELCSSSLSATQPPQKLGFDEWIYPHRWKIGTKAILVLWLERDALRRSIDFLEHLPTRLGCRGVAWEGPNRTNRGWTAANREQLSARWCSGLRPRACEGPKLPHLRQIRGRSRSV